MLSTFSRSVVYRLSPNVNQIVNWNLEHANCMGSSPWNVSGGLRIFEAACKPLELEAVEPDIVYICVNVCSAERAAQVAASVRLMILWNIASCSIAAVDLFRLPFTIRDMCSPCATFLQGFTFETALRPIQQLSNIVTIATWKTWPPATSTKQLSLRKQKLRWGERSHQPTRHTEYHAMLKSTKT